MPHGVRAGTGICLFTDQQFQW
ncbi:hypothetical protein [Marinobacter sp. SS8-8]